MTTMEDVFLKVGQREEDLASRETKKDEASINVFGENRNRRKAATSFLQRNSEMLITRDCSHRIFPEIRSIAGTFLDIAAVPFVVRDAIPQPSSGPQDTCVHDPSSNILFIPLHANSDAEKYEQSVKGK